jgi:N-acetyl-D-muramate 6-phosphate phosphatase
VAASYGYLGGRPDWAQWGADAHIAAPLELLALLQSAAAS